MREITFYLDFVSPYAWLAFQQLPHTLQGVDCHVRYRPIFLGALLKQQGGLPSLNANKLAWIYRHTQWLAQQMDQPLDMPASHPFNPLTLLRLAQQCTFTGETSRWVTECFFRHVWQGGLDAEDETRLPHLQAQVARFLDTDPSAPERARKQLREMTQQAIDDGVFGVPTFLCEGQLFWGLDALPMLRHYLLHSAPPPAQAGAQL